MWSRAHGLPGISALGAMAEVRMLTAKAALTSSSMKANPGLLSVTELTKVMAAPG
jgi:hypothetical protein